MENKNVGNGSPLSGQKQSSRGGTLLIADFRVVDQVSHFRAHTVLAEGPLEPLKNSAMALAISKPDGPNLSVSVAGFLSIGAPYRTTANS